MAAEQPSGQPIRKVVDITRRARPGVATLNNLQPPPAQDAAGQASARAKAAKVGGGFSFAVVCFYIFMHTALFGEIMAVFAHLEIPMVAGMAVVVSLLGLFHGGLGRFGQSPMARPWLMLAIWMSLASLLSYSKGTSISYIIPYILRFMAMPLLFCAFAVTTVQAQKLIVWAALGLYPMLFLCVVKGEMFEGARFGIADTTMKNPNDLAFSLLWLSTLVAIYFFRDGKLGKLLAICAIPAAMWFVLKTASRANFISLFVLMAVLFLILPNRARIAILIGVPVALAVTLVALPGATRDRIFAVVVSSEADVSSEAQGAAGDQNVEGALASQAARMELSRLAIEATLRHPIFGAGPLMFADETAAFIMETTGKKAPWQTAHDSYLKISSETGLPGMIFYVWAILSGLRCNYKTYKETEGKPEALVANRNALCLLLALTTYAFGTFFCDIVYLPFLPITIGMTAANTLAARDEKRSRLAAARAAGVPA